MEILIISGMSGAGKSRAAICLEDSGYYIVDNLPAEMMVKFAEFCAAAGGRYDRLAFVYDVRAGEPFDRLTGAVEELRWKSCGGRVCGVGCCFWRRTPRPSSTAIRRHGGAILCAVTGPPLKKR